MIIFFVLILGHLSWETFQVFDTGKNCRMNRWIGRVAVVTGASSGIGAAICKELVKRGLLVLGCARRIQEIETMAKSKQLSKYKGKLFAYRCDMTIESDILAMYDYLENIVGSLDVCINNAMCCINSSLLTGSTEDWRHMIKLGVEGMCISTREAVKLMQKNIAGDGQIIQMGSIVGHKIPEMTKLPDVEPPPCFHIYNGVKFMTRALTDGLRQELKAQNSRIRIATISPGAVETNLLFRSLGLEVAIPFYYRYKCLNSTDVVEAVIQILKAPPHASVNDIILEPRAFTI